jgi:hypothetical protein
MTLEPIYKWNLNKNDQYDCFQNILANIAARWNCELSMLFSLIWCFGFDATKGQTINEHISMGFRPNPYRYVAKYNGIKYQFADSKPCTPQEFYHFLQSCKKKDEIPVICIDGIYCDWTRFYQKTNIQRYCFVNGMTEDGLICLDTYSTENQYEIYPYENLEKYEYEILVFKRCEKCSTIDVKDMLKRLYDEVARIDFPLLYEQFAGAMTYDKLVAEMPEIEDVETQLFFIIVNAFVLHRKNMACYFEYIYQISGYDKLNQIVSLFKKSSQYWNKIKLYMLRFTMLRTQSELSIVVKYINNVRDAEQAVLEHLGAILKEDFGGGNTNAVSVISSGDGNA